MTGVVLETLRMRKLVAFAVFSLMVQTAFFLIGGLVAPPPHTSEQILMSRCVEPPEKSDKWLYVRRSDSNHSISNCVQLLPDTPLEDISLDFREGDFVFIAQFPLPRDGIRLSMSRWFQQILGVGMLDIKQKYGNETLPNDAYIVFDLRLGYRNRNEPSDVWHELARSTEKRPLQCVLESAASCHYDEYLLNLRIPHNLQGALARSGSVLEDVWMVEIHQNGGFTKIWFGLKTFVFPLSLLALCFFVSRVLELKRPLLLLEKTIVVLGAGLIVLNCPVEWISLLWNSSFWIVLSDIRQGLFFAVLVCFWLVFTGEHMMDGSRANTRIYWPRLLLVAGSCAALCIFELAERGVQISNPFYSIWSNPTSARLGIASVVLGAVCATAYMAYLVYMVGRALAQILNKRRLLSNLPPEQGRFYRGVIYRFTALLGYTLVCAALTVSFFIFSRLEQYIDSPLNIKSI